VANICNSNHRNKNENILVFLLRKINLSVNSSIYLIPFVFPDAKMGEAFCAEGLKK